MAIKTPVIGISVPTHSTASIGYLRFQISLWDASNHAIIWFANIIYNISLLIISIAIVGIYIDSP